MDHAVALVQAYLQINGYFTVTEYPVIEALGEHSFRVATDLDILAFRFPGAGRLIAGKSIGNHEIFAPDIALGVSGLDADMLIGEIKVGKAELNRNALHPDVLRTVLARFGCCSFELIDDIVKELVHKGIAHTHSQHHVRLMAFGSTASDHHNYKAITIGHIVEFIENYLDEHWDVLRHGQYKHPALGLFMVLKKARLEIHKGNQS